MVQSINLIWRWARTWRVVWVLLTQYTNSLSVDDSFLLSTEYLFLQRNTLLLLQISVQWFLFFPITIRSPVFSSPVVIYFVYCLFHLKSKRKATIQTYVEIRINIIARLSVSETNELNSVWTTIKFVTNINRKLKLSFIPVIVFSLSLFFIFIF